MSSRLGRLSSDRVVARADPSYNVEMKITGYKITARIIDGLAILRKEERFQLQQRIPRSQAQLPGDELVGSLRHDVRA